MCEKVQLLLPYTRHSKLSDNYCRLRYLCVRRRPEKLDVLRSGAQAGAAASLHPRLCCSPPLLIHYRAASHLLRAHQRKGMSQYLAWRLQDVYIEASRLDTGTAPAHARPSSFLSTTSSHARTSGARGTRIYYVHTQLMASEAPRCQPTQYRMTECMAQPT